MIVILRVSNKPTNWSQLRQTSFVAMLPNCWVRFPQDFALPIDFAVGRVVVSIEGSVPRAWSSPSRYYRATSWSPLRRHIVACLGSLGASWDVTNSPFIIHLTPSTTSMHSFMAAFLLSPVSSRAWIV